MVKIVKKITLRDLYRNAGKIAREVERGVSFEVRVRGKKSFKISPFKIDENSESDSINTKKSAHELFSQMMFKSKDSKLSSKIDNIIYDKN